ncbi:MAG: STAS/SEC14 domain-containing protein [Longimicrobiales bacterium]
MPVHARTIDGLIHLVVDGDYTSEELRRVGAAAVDGATAPRTSVFVDFSGAAGLHRKTPADLRTTAAFFGSRRERLGRVAVLAPTDVGYGLMRMGAAFGDADGLAVQAFRTRAEALAWLRSDPGYRATAETR